MYPRDYIDDRDTCDCTFGKSCDYHQKLSDESSRRAREDLESRGINPDGQVTEELAELLFLVEGCDSLSRRQKDAIQRIIFPL